MINKTISLISDKSNAEGGGGENENPKQRTGRYRKKQENVKKGRLIIRNISFKTTDEAIKKEFGKFGEITEVNILKKPDGKLVGCAFVQYENYPDSVKAIQAMTGKDFLKRKITVDFAVSKNRYQVEHPTENKSEIKTEDEKPEIKDEIKEEDEEEVKKEDSDEEDEGVDSGDEDDDMAHEEEVHEAIKPERNSNDEDHDYTIFVKNLSFDTTNEMLLECFKKYGPIKYALTVRDPVSGHSKGTGFVRFLKKESVNMCLQQTGLIQLQNYTLEIFPSLPRQKIKSLEDNKTKKEPTDTRNMYLLREGMVLAGSAAADGLSATDMSKRLRLEQIKSSMLKNLNRFISKERLTIHNLPETYDDAKMRKMVFARTGVKPVECKVMRENKPTAGDPEGKLKGFGFISFKKHEDALNALRKLNNNPEIFSANHRPIVSFSIEDKKVLNIKERRKERSMLNNPTYQKKLEKVKLKKATRKKERKEQKDKKEKKPAVAAPPKPQDADNQENTDSYSGFAAKPGAFVKLRGTQRLKEQSKIHEKSMQDKNKKVKRDKLAAEIHKERSEKKLDRQPAKRKIDSGTSDNLSKMIDKYKNMIQGGNGEPEGKKAKTRGKWFMD